MSEQQQNSPAEHKPQAAHGPIIHRVCVTCNNTFRVTAENYEAKQCSNCHKGG